MMVPSKNDIDAYIEGNDLLLQVFLTIFRGEAVLQWSKCAWRKGAINVKFLRSLSVLSIVYEKECQNENKLRDDICKKKRNRKRIMQSKEAKNGE